MRRRSFSLRGFNQSNYFISLALQGLLACHQLLSNRPILYCTPPRTSNSGVHRGATVDCKLLLTGHSSSWPAVTMFQSCSSKLAGIVCLKLISVQTASSSLTSRRSGAAWTPVRMLNSSPYQRGCLIEMRLCCSTRSCLSGGTRGMR